MKKDIFLSLMVLIVLIWAYPVYESVTNDAKGMEDLSKAARWMVWTGMGVFFYLVHPLFLWMWNWVKRWLDGK